MPLAAVKDHPWIVKNTAAEAAPAPATAPASAGATPGGLHAPAASALSRILPPHAGRA